MKPLRLLLGVALVLGLTTGAFAQAVTIKSADQLQKLMAPVALYSDDLLACVLTAATVPSELSQATTWLAANPGPLTTMPDNDWDPGVKSLLAFPTVLQMMTANSSWTRQVGQAMLAQPQDVLAAVQAYRSMLVKSGALDSSSYQAVNTTGTAVTITPTAPQTIYVPTYQTDEYDYYRPSVSWGEGVTVGAWWGFRNLNWTANSVTVDPARITAFNYPATSAYAKASAATVWTPTTASVNSYAAYRSATGKSTEAPPSPSRAGEASAPPVSGQLDSGLMDSGYPSGYDAYGYGYGYGYGGVAPGVRAAQASAWAGANRPAVDNAAGLRGGASRYGGGFRGFGGGRR